jgi:hypothetical protein
MKHFLLLTFAFLMQTAQATELAKYKFAIRDDENQFYTIESTLHEEQTLNVLVYTSEGSFPSRLVEFNEYEFNVSKLNFTRLEEKAMFLQKAEVISLFSQIVCMLMPSPEQSNDHLYVQDENEGLKMIMSPNGCWNSRKVFPKKEYSVQLANELKQSLKTLTLEKLEL